MSQCKISAQRQPEPPPQPETWNFQPRSEIGKIVAFSGKLASGKDSCCRFLYSLAFMHILGLTDEAFVNEEGKLVVRNEDGFHLFDEDSKDPAMVKLLGEAVWPYIRKFSTADPLKNFLRKMFKVPVESLWGTQEQKLVKLDHILWEKMPGNPKPPKGKSGPMGGRELMEFFGTEVVRNIYETAHAEALVSDILDYNSAHSLVNDIRFKCEVLAIQSVGGKVIRLGRVTEEALANTHTSNTELDDYEGFDAVIPDGLTLQETFAELLRILTEFGWFGVVQQ